MKAVAVRVTGLVQGVGYRAWAESAARSRGLNGWVRNRRDGSVELLVAGDDQKLDELLAYLWQGPVASRVDRVSFEPASPPAQLGFRVLPTA